MIRIEAGFEQGRFVLRVSKAPLKRSHDAVNQSKQVDPSRLRVHPSADGSTPTWLDVTEGSEGVTLRSDGAHIQILPCGGAERDTVLSHVADCFANAGKGA